jgi:hypothetical protein
MATVLYSSRSIRAKISEVLGEPSKSDRRVALVAYLGRGADAYLPPGEVDIDRLIACASPEPVTTAGLARLHRANKLLPPRIRRPIEPPSHPEDYLAWYHSPYRNSDPWKFGWWSDSVIEIAKAAKAKSRTEFGKSEPEDALNVASGTVEKSDWLLCFEIADGKTVRNLTWMFVDFLVPVRRSESGVYEREYPLQAIQVFP